MESVWSDKSIKTQWKVYGVIRVLETQWKVYGVISVWSDKSIRNSMETVNSIGLEMK